MPTTGYNNAEKKRWRKWVWQRIAERYGPRRKRATARVLYLAGLKDYDRRRAVHEGFSPNNLMIAEIDGAAVKSHRESGRVSIRGDICEIAACGLFGDRFDVVFADLCGDIKEQEIRLAKAYVCGAISEGGVLAINLCRGHSRNPLVKNIGNISRDHFAQYRVKEHKHGCMGAGTLGLHRGLIFDGIIKACWNELMTEHAYQKDINSGCLSEQTMELRSKQLPVMTSYRGTRKDGKVGVTMDTYICNSIGAFPDLDECRVQDFIGTLDKKTSRKLAAARAVATMRQSGRLESQPAR